MYILHRQNKHFNNILYNNKHAAPENANLCVKCQMCPLLKFFSEFCYN